MLKDLVKSLKPSSTLAINEISRKLEEQGKQIFKFYQKRYNHIYLTNLFNTVYHKQRFKINRLEKIIYPKTFLIKNWEIVSLTVNIVSQKLIDFHLKKN